MSTISVGDKVEWQWGNGTGTGRVTERYTEDVTRSVKGTHVTRAAKTECPAYLIEQEDGAEVLKSASELSRC